MELIKKITLVVLLFQLYACTSEDDNGGIENPTDPNTVFNLFPSDYLTEGYSETYVLSGQEELTGDTFTGSFTLQTQVQDLFNSESAVPMYKELEITNSSTGGTSTKSGVDYYSTNYTNINYLGYSGILHFSGISSTQITESASTTMLPITGKIGDSGVIGTYVDSYDDTKSLTWSIHDAGNGNAKLKIVTTTSPNQLGTVLLIEEETYTINPDGVRLSIVIRIEYTYSGITINLNGNNT